MIEPNIDRKWNEGAGYHWTRDNEGRPLAITASDYKKAIATAQRKPEDARAYASRCHEKQLTEFDKSRLSWVVNDMGNALVLTPKEHDTALDRADCMESQRDAFLRSQLRAERWRGHSFAALYLLVGFTLGALLMLTLAHLGRPT